MDKTSDFLGTKRTAVVTGANKGMGLEICRQLASKGITVVLTARDENKGLEALNNLKDSGLSDNVIVQKLDVVDSASVVDLAEFVSNRFGKLDILVNNAAIIGVAIVDQYSLITSSKQGPQFINWHKVSAQSFDLVKECIDTNYYGAKRMVEAFLPLLQSSDSPRIVNISSLTGKLKFVGNEWAQSVLGDEDSLTEEKVNDVLNEFLKDFKANMLETRGWPTYLSAYALAKASLNAYTRILAKKHPRCMVNSVCPGYVKTDLNCNTGPLTAEEGAESPVWLSLLPTGGPSGFFFSRKLVSPF
ncbi:hypothetical protein Leryth_026355 [Lithospermum erythrorhizon]|nr:hypothetical protein Leryth_026355 [Lithospermum erythrorhizon]